MTNESKDLLVERIMEKFKEKLGEKAMIDAEELATIILREADTMEEAGQAQDVLMNEGWITVLNANLRKYVGLGPNSLKKIES